jgi:general secretion pathway protein M
MRYLDYFRKKFSSMDHRTRIRIGMAICLVLVLAIVISAANTNIAAMEKRRKVRETDLMEMMTLKQRYLSARVSYQQMAGRLAATGPDDSPARIIEEIGIVGKGRRVTPLMGEEREGFIEDAAEVRLDGLSANEAINLLHRLETGSRPVVIKKAAFKTRFDDPSRLDVVLTIALLRPRNQVLR